MAAETTKTESDGEGEAPVAGGEAKARWWCAEIEHALKERREWLERAQKVERAYHDERRERRGRRSKLNILFANVETLRPAIYMQTPKPVAVRRWRQRDPVGRLSAMLLERCLQVCAEEGDFDHAMDQAVRDRLLPGLGQTWAHYEPVFAPEPELGEDGAPAMDEGGQPRTYQDLIGERALCEYVRWDDFLTNPARTWGEVWWGARRHYFTRKRGVERFGEQFKQAVLDHRRQRGKREEDDGSGPASRQSSAVVWEIWDRDEGEVLFLAPGSGVNALLEARPAPLRFDGFFPFPRPLAATTTSESSLPQADYLQYQDQAKELDEITARIDKLVRALKVAGIYAKENTALAKLFSAGEGEMIGVDEWAMHGEAGGVAKQVEWYPVEAVAKVLRELYTARADAKTLLYEISGIADVMRGATDPDETLGAQKLKARWGSGRVRRMQKDVQRFAGDNFGLLAEIIAEGFQFDTMLEMAGVDRELLAKYVPAGTDPAALMQIVEQTLRHDMRRAFRIRVETDSTLEPDEAAERAWRTQFLQGMAALLKELSPLAAQGAEAAKLAGELMMMGVRGFKEADQLEEAVEQTVEAAGKAAQARQRAAAAAQAQAPPKDPRLADVERKAKRDEAELIIAARRADAEGARDAAELELEGREFETDAAFRAAELRLNRMNGAAKAMASFDLADAVQ